ARVVYLIVELLAGYAAVRRVGDDYDVSHVQVGGVGRLMLAQQWRRHACRETAKGLAVGVDDVPGLLDASGAEAIGFCAAHSLVPYTVVGVGACGSPRRVPPSLGCGARFIYPRIGAAGPITPGTPVSGASRIVYRSAAERNSPYAADSVST